MTTKPDARKDDKFREGGTGPSAVDPSCATSAVKSHLPPARPPESAVEDVASPIFTVTGTIVEMGDLEHGRGMVIGKSATPVTLLGLSKDELIATRMAFGGEVTLTVRPK